VGTSRRQSLSLGVTHCPLPQLVEEVEEQEERVDELVERQENAWDWLVVFASFLCLCVLDGVSYTFGMFLEPLTRDLGIGLGAASMVGSLQVAVTCVSGVFAARVVGAVGPRPVAMVGALLGGAGLLGASLCTDFSALLATYSLVAGLGFGLMYVPAVVAVAEHFTTRRALATGLCVCGTGVGTSLLAPLEEVLLEDAGWRTTLRVVALLCTLCVLCGAAMTRPEGLEVQEEHPALLPQQEEQAPRGLVRLLLGPDLPRSPLFIPFLFVAVADALATLALFLPFLFLPDLAKDAGVDATKAATLVSVAGLSSSLGRILSGLLCDRPWCDPLILTMLSVGLASVPPLLLPMATSFTSLLLLAAAYGLLTGAWIAATSPLLVSILGIQLLPAAFGLMTAAQGLAALAGPPLAGALVEYVGKRGPALQLSSAILFLAAIGFLLAYRSPFAPFYVI